MLATNIAATGTNVSNAPEGNRQRMTARSFLQNRFRPAAMQWDLHSRYRLNIVDLLDATVAGAWNR